MPPKTEKMAEKLLSDVPKYFWHGICIKEM